MATWYVRTGGSDLNSGSTDTDAASQSGASGAVVGTTLTEVGAFAAAAATGAINLQDAGNSLIRTYTKVNNDSITLDSAPTSGDGTYAWKIGGARAAIKKVVTTGAGNNAKIASGDLVLVQTGTYTENVVAPASGVLVYGNGGFATIDGTGGGAGSDCLAGPGTYYAADIVCQNAVDIGIVSLAGGGAILSRCKALTCGGSGAGWCQDEWVLCTFRGNGSHGAYVSGTNGRIVDSECAENSGSGIYGGNGWTVICNTLVYDNGSNGFTWTSAPGAKFSCAGNTFEGNTGDGIQMDLVSCVPSVGASIVNNIFSNNSAYGIDSSAGAQTNVLKAVVSHNLFYGNGTASNRNFTEGTNAVTTDPQFTDAAGDDYSIKFAGGAYKAGYSPFKNPTLNALNIGAVPGIGSDQTVGGGGGGSGGGPWIMPMGWHRCR